MKKNILRFIPCILCCVLMACACGNTTRTTAVGDPQLSTGVTISAAEAADTLYKLGLFYGTGIDAYGNPVYELERTPNRHEAIAMLVRFLGKAEVAKASSWTTPFKDVDAWAKPYVGYAYEHKITFGTSKSTFSGNSNTKVSEYITFMLRALGYVDKTDFEWDKAWELSDKIGMTNGEYNSSTKSFTRGDMVIISYSTLFCKMKNGMTLYDHLVAEGVIMVENEEGDTTSDTREIITPYLTLYFDEAFVDHVVVEHNSGQPYTLKFYVALDNRAKQHIFDICIGNGCDGNLGVIHTDLGEVPASIIMYSFTPDNTWTQGEIDTVFAAQEASNDLINQLTDRKTSENVENPGSSTEKQENNKYDYTEIKTPYATMYFPGEWKEYLKVSQIPAEEYWVRIYADIGGKQPILLYSIIFGGDRGDQVGVVKNNEGGYVTVNVLWEDLSTINYPEKDMTTFYAMQETVNTLIAQLPIE